MDNVPLFDTITILVGVSVFSTGFLSVRIHAKRDRLLERVSQIGQHLKDPTTLQGEQYAYGPKLILEEFGEYKEANQPDLIAVLTALGNFGVFFLVIVLSGLIINARDWEFTTELSRVVPEFWGLTIVALVELGVALLGWFDVRFVHKDIADRLNRSFAMHLNNASLLEARGDFDKAMENYDKIVTNWPATHLSYFLRGKAYLHRGDWQATRDAEEAKQCYEKAHKDFMESSEHFSSSSIYYFASEASLKAGNDRQAVLEATRAITLAPNNARPYILRAIAHRRLGHINQARSDHQTAKELNPSLNSNDALARNSNISLPLAQPD
jgi:tetratricopeptide (TPR) repeat protein